MQSSADGAYKGHPLLHFCRKLIYNGPQTEITEHFAKFGHKCPPAHNPADFLLYLAQTEKDVALDKLAAAVHAQAADRGGTVGANEGMSVNRAAAQPVAKPGFWTQLRLLSVRQWHGVVRNKPALVARFLMTAILNALFGWW
jgi:hypothetical protein